jgi:hypothetical protein
VISTVPAVTPVTTPVPVATVAIAGLALDHVPPAVALLSVVVRPGQTINVPVIAAGAVFTVTVVVTGVNEVLQESASVTVTVYTPDAVGKADGIEGLGRVLVKPSGPDQL